MKKRILSGSVLVLSAMIATQSFAAPNDDQDQQRQKPAQQQQGQNQQGHQNQQGGRGDYQGSQQSPQGDQQGARHRNQGPGEQGRQFSHGGHDFKRGQHVPNDIRRNPEYRVDNWNEHGLRQPPRGYRWVNVDGNYVLISIVSGVIANILMHGPR